MHASAVDPAHRRPVPAGPRAYRSQLRAFGPVAALLIPAMLGVAALISLHGSTSAGRGVGGFVLAVFAAPALLVAGVPLRSGTGLYIGAVAASAVMWLLLGTLASRRATRRPVATWRNFWHEFAWLLAGVWAGVGVGLLAANLLLGQSVV